MANYRYKYDGEDSRLGPDLSWKLEWSDGVFDDSVYVKDILSRKFGSFYNELGNIWICVLDKEKSRVGKKHWTAWVHLAKPMTVIQMKKHMMQKESPEFEISPIMYTDGEPCVPQDIVHSCILGQPYVQHGIPVQWSCVLHGPQIKIKPKEYNWPEDKPEYEP